MTKRNDPYFTPQDIDPNEVLIEIEPETAKPDPYFTPIDDQDPLAVPESISSHETINAEAGYQFVQNGYPETKTLKRLFITSLAFFTIIIAWQAYSTLIALFDSNSLLGIGFGFLIATLVFFIIKSIHRFKQSQKQVARIERLRDQAQSFVNERSQGKSAAFVAELTDLYAGRPQQHYLINTCNQLPDYLNDAEIIERLSTDFLTQLDDEAKRLVTQHSMTTGTLVAVSQVAVIDSMIVIWRTLSMVNQINSIYGLSLTRFGLWQFFIHIIKAALFSAGTQIGITALVHKFAPGISGSVLGTVAQGVGMATYVAKIGIEAMKQARPIAFTDDTMPDINLIRGNISEALLRMTESKADTPTKSN